jgi:hypothetical protein
MRWLSEASKNVNHSFEACHVMSMCVVHLMPVQQIMLNAFGKAKGEEAERELSRAFSRSGRSFSGKCSKVHKQLLY